MRVGLAERLVMENIEEIGEKLLHFLGAARRI